MPVTAIATVEFDPSNTMDTCIVKSTKPVLSMAIDDIKEKLLAESDYWFGEWKAVHITVSKE